jgi:hypothetical protein
MRKISGLISWTVLVVVLTGCDKFGGSGQTAATSPKPTPQTDDDSPATAKLEPPAAAVAEFLEAVRTGNDEKAGKMLSTTARQKTAALNRNVTPPASDTAKFAIGKVDWVGEDGARVACTWTDVDTDGQPKTDEAIWVVRREPEGWRIVGVAAMVFPGEQPVVLNFEDPEDMLRQQQWIREEIRRRMEKEAGGLQAEGKEGGDLQAKGKENPEKPVLR